MKFIKKTLEFHLFASKAKKENCKRYSKTFLLNMRLPDERKGDLNAQISACRLTKRIQELIKTWASYLNIAFEEILKDQSLECKCNIKTSRWKLYFTDYMDDDGLNTKNNKISVDIKKKKKIFDFLRLMIKLMVILI